MAPLCIRKCLFSLCSALLKIELRTTLQFFSFSHVSSVATSHVDDMMPHHIINSWYGAWSSDKTKFYDFSYEYCSIVESHHFSLLHAKILILVRTETSHFLYEFLIMFHELSAVKLEKQVFSLTKIYSSHGNSFHSVWCAFVSRERRTEEPAEHVKFTRMTSDSFSWCSATGARCD